MRLITEDNDKKTYLIYITKDELDKIESLAHYVELVEATNNESSFVHTHGYEKEFRHNFHAFMNSINSHIKEGGDE